MNALVVVLTPLVLLGLVQHVFPRVLPSVASERAAPRSVWAHFAVIVLFAVMRNLPFEPFSWLAPR
jgi:apolipoprotein N-acyltransferase